MFRLRKATQASAFFILLAVAVFLVLLIVGESGFLLFPFALPWFFLLPEWVPWNGLVWCLCVLLNAFIIYCSVGFLEWYLTREP